VIGHARNLTLFVSVAWCVAACGSAVPAPAVSTRPRAGCDYYDYRFEIDAALRTVTATVCFDGTPPSALVCGPHGDAEYAPHAERISFDGVTPLATAGCRIDLSSFVAGDCVRYSVDMTTLAQPYPLSLGIEAEHLVAAQVGAFMFRPPVRGRQIHGHATFELPDGVRASLPWQRDADGYLLDATAFEFVGYAVFGTFESERVPAAGVTIDAVMLGPLGAATRQAIVPWLNRVATSAARMGGKFPAARAQMLLQTVPGGGGVRFGMTGRGGGPSIVLMLGSESTERELIESWEPVHETIHLRTPYLQRADRWLTEGIATYYQEVLRARDGVITPERAWQRLASGFGRGRNNGTGRTLRAEAADMFTTAAYARVYWFGAALLMLADIELRAATHNATSLDSALLQLEACCSHDAQAWTADQMIARIDEFAGQPVLRAVVDRHLDAPAFPDTEAALVSVGVKFVGETLTFDRSAPQAAVGDAIMSPQPNLTTALTTAP